MKNEKISEAIALPRSKFKYNSPHTRLDNFASSAPASLAFFPEISLFWTESKLHYYKRTMTTWLGSPDFSFDDQTIFLQNLTTASRVQNKPEHVAYNSRLEKYVINTSSSSRWQAHMKTSSNEIMIGSQPSFFHGIFMLSFPTRPTRMETKWGQCDESYIQARHMHVFMMRWRETHNH